MVTPVLCAHWLTAGQKFVWSVEYNTYLPDSPHWLIIMYQMAAEWVKKMQSCLLAEGVWDLVFSRARSHSHAQVFACDAQVRTRSCTHVAASCFLRTHGLACKG